MTAILPEDRTLRVTPAIDSAGDMCHGCVLLNDDDERICEVDIWPKDRRDVMARLFASAPRMLEVLIDIEKLLVRIDMTDFPLYNELDDVRNVIHESTGQREVN